jgi:hypothetical protein
MVEKRKSLSSLCYSATMMNLLFYTGEEAVELIRTSSFIAKI